MNEERFAAAEKTLSYTFKKRDILWEALQAPDLGVPVAGSRPIPNGNKRLAALGDRVRAQVITHDWYLSGDTVGQHQARIQAVTTRSYDARVFEDLGLEECVLKGRSHVGDTTVNMKSDVIGALIGAVYLDSGSDLSVARTLLSKLGVTYQPSTQGSNMT